MDAVFRRLKGVDKVVTGYSGGTTENPTMEQVYAGNTGHAECVQITFDPTIISYEKLLTVFFHLHDPTVLQQPGTMDTGDEYRSVIFYHDENQKKIADKLKGEIPKALTEIIPFIKFYPAQESQQEYYEKNSYQPYCQYIIDPKITKLTREFAADLKN